MPVARDLASLPYTRYLQPFTGALEPGDDHSEIHLDDVELDQTQAGGSRFSESAMTAVTFTGGNFERVRLDDVWISRSRWINLRGAVIDSSRLAEAAPALAQTLGVVIRDR